MKTTWAALVVLLATTAQPAAATKPTTTAPASHSNTAEAAKAGSKQAQANAAAGFVEETLTLPIFGKATVYRPEPLTRARGVILFISGDGGWNLGVVDMARRSAPRALVVGLSMPVWQKAIEKDPNHCWFPAGELESIAQTVEKSYRLPRYLKPLVVGYSSGATVAFAALAQAPPDTFSGAISLGFCDDVDVARPVCGKTSWKPEFVPKKHLSILPPDPEIAPRPGGAPRWIALQGLVDQVCDPNAVGTFAARIPAAKRVDLPKVGHGFSVPRHWGASFDAAVDEMLDPASPWEPLPESARHVVVNHSPADIQGRLDALDLPLEVQWPTDGTEPSEALIFVSGDGGWADIDQRIATSLASRGIGVVGWNTLRYFWSERTPEAFQADLARVIEALPPEIRVYAGGYSFGAEIMPVAVAHHPGAEAAGLSRISGLVLLAPGPFASFEVSPLDWIRSTESPTRHPVAQAIEATDGIPVLCLTGAEQGESGCPAHPAARVRNVTLAGGHHFGGDYDALSLRIAEFMRGGPVSGAETPPATGG
ncbi:MAG TPA: AcvB/VirJ family lysyl-phosphatidylglycerol hydrolase [Verrucomicrobiae bacterium]|nr:AcvB/VirJ family lysyl-phosphatidylglycerol hydrolase [Verrucomicrobiae bacterium]